MHIFRIHLEKTKHGSSKHARIYMNESFAQKVSIPRQNDFIFYNASFFESSILRL